MDENAPDTHIRRHTPGGTAELWLLAFPVIVATLSQSLMGVVDTFFMGHIGTAEQAAVGLAMITFWTVTALFVGTLQGVSTFAAQHHGAGEYARCGRDGWLVLYVTLPSAVVLGIMAFASQWIFELMRSDEAILPHATNYLAIRLAGGFFVCINHGLISWLRGIGDTKTPMYFTIGANVLNAILNYALVLGNLGMPRLGAVGAATASVIATAVFSLVYLVFFLTGERRRKYETHRIKPPTVKEGIEFLKVGAAIGGSWALEMTAWAVFMFMVSYLGTVQLAATNIVFQVLHFSFMGAVSLGTAATTLVGQYLGAEDTRTAKKAAVTTIRSGVLYCVTLGLIFMVARRQIAGVFNRDPAVIDVCTRLFVYAAVFQFFDGLGISSNGVIRGAGDTRWPMMVMSALAWLVFMPLTYVLTFPLGYGIDGAWIAVTVFIAAVGMALYYRQRSGKWLGMRV